MLEGFRILLGYAYARAFACGQGLSSRHGLFRHGSAHPEDLPGMAKANRDWPTHCS
jgi:hypothetical protein